MKSIDIIHTPSQVSAFDIQNKLVVVVDIFRATSTMVTALANGVVEIVPCATTKEVFEYQKKDYLATGERNGIKVEGMDYENSPLSYEGDTFLGKKMALTTTNGTQAIASVGDQAQEIIVGAYLNMEAVRQYCLQSKLDLAIVCSGWYNKPSLEDLYFAAELISGIPHIENDSTFFVKSLLKMDRQKTLTTSEHALRLYQIDKEADVNYCLLKNKYPIVPKIINGKIVT